MSTSRTAIVLAGGRSSRFGLNKGLQTLAGKALIRHVAERLSGAVDEVLVVVGRDESKAKYEAVLLSLARVINDDQEGKNPLVGVVSGLRAVESDLVAVLACDTPFISRAVIDLLFQRASDADAAIPRWNAGRIEPLQAVYRRLPTLRAAQEALANRDSSQKEMINRLARVVYISVEDEIRSIDPSLRTFFNINAREDMLAAERMAGEKNSSQ